MPVPPGFGIRVGHRAPNLPYPVNLHLPSIAGDAALDVTESTARMFGPELDVFIPADHKRHELLGRFLEAWSLLENMLVFFIGKLLETDRRSARYVANTLGMKQIIDLLNALALSKLNAQQSARMITLMERVGKLNSKRNVLVHGHWVLEANVLAKNGVAFLRLQFLRETTPPDPTIAKLIEDHRNQKERVKYIFTLKRIEGATKDVGTLAADLAAFLREMTFSPEWIAQRPGLL